LALRELDVAHARVRQREREAVQAAAIPVAEMAPIHLALFAGAGLEANEGPFASFLAPRRHHQLPLRISAWISAVPPFFPQLARIVDTLFPSFAQKAAVGVDFRRRRILALVRLRRLHQILADGFAVEVELLGDGRYAPPVVLQVTDSHKSLQSEHR